MAQIDSNATLEQVAQMEREFARKRMLAERKRAAELARLSETRDIVDERGTAWEYVVVDGSFARITSCTTEEELLAVPGEIAGLPVREIGDEALSKLSSPREIICAPNIESIGAYAFRLCDNLRKLVLPARTANFSGGWIAKCPSLEELVLPEDLQVLSAEILSNPALTKLVVGANTLFVEPGAFDKSNLECIVIDERNTHLRTDGTCIYAADGISLVALARPVRRYEIAAGCRQIAKKAFAGFPQLEEVVLPAGLESIDDLAFARSGITAIECPESLAAIGPKAFLGCRSLEKASLHDGLRSIGDHAFANTALQSLHLPASVDMLGFAVCEKSNVRFSGTDATISIDEANPVYSIDEQGCLYRSESDGMHLAEMLGREGELAAVRELEVVNHVQLLAAGTDVIECILVPYARALTDGHAVSRTEHLGVQLVNDLVNALYVRTH